MSSLPTDALGAAEFLVGHLYRSIEVTDTSTVHAVAELENPGADSWFWNDDNAKTLELLSRPEIWRRFPRETVDVLSFVRSMCRGPFIFRRISAPRLEETAKQGNLSGYLHSLMRIAYDLEHGAIALGVRFHDERSADNLVLTGNRVEFTYRRRRFRVGVEPAITAVEARQVGHGLRLRHASELHFTPLWRPVRLGRIVYTTSFDARSMLFDVEVALELNPAIQVSDVMLTIGHDYLDYCFFTNIAADTQPTGEALFSAGAVGRTVVAAAGAGYYAIRQGHVSGDALAIHTVPHGPGRLAAIEARVEPAGKLRRVIARYDFPGPHRGASLVAAEHKLLTAGGFYQRIADYAGFVDEAVRTRTTQRAAYDFSISYDYGVTINAFAKCYAVCAGGQVVPEPPSLTGELRQMFDQYLQYYFELYVDPHQHLPNAIFSRELSFVVLAVVTMYRATGADEYLRRLRRLCDTLLDFELRFDDGTGSQASGFLMRMDSPRAAYVDCHSAALLALTQAARFVSDARLAPVIDRGLSGYSLETCRYPGGIVDTAATLMVSEQGAKHVENAYWNFKAGLTLRFFAALRSSPDPALQAVAAKHRERMDLFETIMRRQFAQSITRHDDGLELRCSVHSAETNSESQPWAMLGLVGHPCD